MYPAGTLNHFEIELNEIRPDLYQVTWVEPATGNTVTHIEDYANNRAWTNITDLASKGFWRLKGTIHPLEGGLEAAEAERVSVDTPVKSCQ